MTTPAGISFPEGTLILIDAEKDYQNGSFVVAKLTDINEATFKKLVIDAGQKFLRPLNTAYPTLPINGNCKIIGVVVDAKNENFFDSTSKHKPDTLVESFQALQVTRHC